MGCGQSKIEGEEAVSRCKERKESMKKAVSSRNAFAAAHSLYTISLKNTGAALSDYGQGEADLILPSSSPSASLPSTSAPTAAIVPPIDTALPPPPPHPDYHQAAPLQRAASMPDLPIPKKHTKVDDAIDEDEEDGDADDEEEDDDDEGELRRRQNLKDGGGDARAIPPPAPVVAAPPQAQQQVAAETSEAPKAAPTPVWLSQYFFDTENIPVPSLSQPEVLPPPPLPREEEEVATELPRPPAAAPAAQKEQEQVMKKKKKVQHQHAASVGGGEGKRGRAAQNVPAVNLVQVLDELDVHFLKASESAHEVSKMLEATRLHYHSNFADNRGHIDHSARLMRVITWNRSCKGLKDDYDGKDDFDNEESETHATILDKMLAWEKKLYDEVKAGELMKIEYQRKIAALNKQKKRGASPETLEKTKAAVSHLHTRYIVDMQSMDSTVSEINRLRDKQLYPKLVDLVDGMAKMWETMFIHHSSQYKIAGVLRNLDISVSLKETSVSLKETSEQHYKRTQQLWQVLFDWHSRFQNLMKYQKEYIQALNDWLKLNLIPIESSLKEKVSSPPRASRPAIQPLLLTWHDLLGKLPDERARGAIHTFSEVVDTILIVQLDELKFREKCEDIRREYIRKKRAFDDWYHKYSEKKAAEAAAAAAASAAAEATEEQNAAVTGEAGSNERADRDEIVVERRAAVESLMVRLKEEEDEYRRTSKKVREKSVGSLKTHLPELFRALLEFAHECSQMYKNLRSLTTETADTLEAD